MAAKSQPGAFAQLLSAETTGVFTQAELEDERLAYQQDFGMDIGDALFRQEYLCDWDAAILGAFYGHEMRQAVMEDRICEVEWQAEFPVHTAWDLGRTDDTVIWFYQQVRGKMHIIERRQHAELIDPGS